jgi:hypothetical protein
VDNTTFAFLAESARNPHGVEVLGGRDSRPRHQIQLAGRKVLGHITTVRIRVAFTAQHAQEYVLQRHSETNGERFRSVVGEEPVESWPEEHRHPNLNFFVAARRRVEGTLSLLYEDLHAFFHEEHGKHLAVKLQRRFVRYNDRIAQ